MIKSWEDLIEKVGPRPGMWVGEKYALVRSFVAGFGEAQDDDVLTGFQRWLSDQPQHDAIRNFAWWSLLLHEAFPDRDDPPIVPGDVEASPDWPRPPHTPVREDTLSYPDDDAIAIRHLFRRLKEYLDSRQESARSRS